MTGSAPAGRALLRAIGCAAATVTLVLGGAAAHADTFVPLPGARVTRTLGDGTVVTLELTNEYAKILPPIGATPLHREVWVNGRGVVTLSGPKAKAKTTGGKLRPGYVVGCQITLEADEQGNAGVAPGRGGLQPAGTQTPGAGIILGPGQAKTYYLLDLERPDDYGNEEHDNYNRFTGSHSSVAWGDTQFTITGCAGYAQARSFVQVEAWTDTADSMITIWGKPFSMG